MATNISNKGHDYLLIGPIGIGTRQLYPSPYTSDENGLVIFSDTKKFISPHRLKEKRIIIKERETKTIPLCFSCAGTKVERVDYWETHLHGSVFEGYSENRYEESGLILPRGLTVHQFEMSFKFSENQVNKIKQRILREANSITRIKFKDIEEIRHKRSLINKIANEICLLVPCAEKEETVTKYFYITTCNKHSKDSERIFAELKRDLLKKEKPEYLFGFQESFFPNYFLQREVPSKKVTEVNLEDFFG